METLVSYSVADGVTCNAIVARETDQGVNLIVFSDDPKVNPNYPIPVFLVTGVKERENDNDYGVWFSGNAPVLVDSASDFTRYTITQDESGNYIATDEHGAIVNVDESGNRVAIDQYGVRIASVTDVRAERSPRRTRG